MVKANKIKKWHRSSRKILYKHPRITLVEDVVILPDGNKVPYLLYDGENNSVTIICIKNGKVLLQQEYSYPVDGAPYQFPGGKINSRESIKAAAVRELTEESGLRVSVKNIKQLGWYYKNNRRSNSKMFVVLAKGDFSQVAVRPDKEEEIISKWVLIKEFEKMLAEGEFVNYSVLSAWTLYKSKIEN